MWNMRSNIDMGGNIPHIILCNMTEEKAFEIMATILGDGGVSIQLPGVENINAISWDGEPFVFILRDIID